MAKIKVYEIKVWDSSKSDWLHPPGKWPLRKIRQIPRATIFEGKEEEVDELDLDEDDHYDPDTRTKLPESLRALERRFEHPEDGEGEL
jgi:hypothetical protein